VRALFEFLRAAARLVLAPLAQAVDAVYEAAVRLVPAARAAA